MMMSFMLLLVALFSFSPLVSAYIYYCPPAVTHKQRQGGRGRVWEVHVSYPDCVGVYPGYSSTYTSLCTADPASGTGACLTTGLSDATGPVDTSFPSISRKKSGVPSGTGTAIPTFFGNSTTVPSGSGMVSSTIGTGGTIVPPPPSGIATVSTTWTITSTTLVTGSV